MCHFNYRVFVDSTLVKVCGTKQEAEEYVAQWRIFYGHRIHFL